MIRIAVCFSTLLFFFSATSVPAQRTAKPVLHGKHWVAITGKPLGATAGAMTFARGGTSMPASCSNSASVKGASMERSSAMFAPNRGPTQATFSG